MKHCESEWEAGPLHFNNERGEPQGEVPFEGHEWQGWDHKMRALEVIHSEISPQLAAIQTAMDDGRGGLESDWREDKEGEYATTHSKGKKSISRHPHQKEIGSKY